VRFFILEHFLHIENARSHIFPPLKQTFSLFFFNILVRRNSLNCVNELLNHHPQINVNQQDEIGMTALHWAASNGNSLGLCFSPFTSSNQRQPAR
jgi:ankyrin repeat protein